MEDKKAMESIIPLIKKMEAFLEMSA